MPLVGLFVGCAGGQQQRMSKSYLDAGDYDRAVVAARKAVEQDPNNPAALDLLSDAQTAAADHHFDRAEKLLQDRRPGEALVGLNKALEFMPAHPGANTSKVAAEQSVARCRELAEQARAAIGREDWEQAVVLAREAYETDQGDGVARALYDHTRTALVSRYLAAAQMALDKGDSPAAIAACTSAKKWDPDNPYVAQLEQRASNGTAGMEMAASPASPSAPTTQPVPVAEAPPSVSSGEPTPPVSTGSGGSAVADGAMPGGPAEQAAAEGGLSQRPRRAEGERIPPRLLRAANAAGEGTSSTAPGQANAVEALADASSAERERLIEVHPTSAGSTRTRPGLATQPANAAHLITMDTASPTSRPGSFDAPDAQPRRGRIVDARTKSSNTQLRGETEGASAPRGSSGRAAAERTEPETRHMFRGALSREDKRYKKQIAVMDGILIKLRDTDGHPVDADFEIVCGSFKVKPDDVRPGGKIEIKGASGRKYVMTVTWIDDDQETVHFSIDRVE